MKDERERPKDDAASGTLDAERSPRPTPVLTRRMVLRGASAVVPTVLTLHSGAALARSSNLISAATNPGPEGGRYHCLDFDGLKPTDNPNVYDLGNPPYAHVTRIDAQTTYYRIEESSQSSNGNGAVGGQRVQVDPQTMCSDGGTFYRQGATGGFGASNDGFTVKRGALVSAAPLSSFSSGIKYTDV